MDSNYIISLQLMRWISISSNILKKKIQGNRYILLHRRDQSFVDEVPSVFVILLIGHGYCVRVLAMAIIRRSMIIKMC